MFSKRQRAVRYQRERREAEEFDELREAVKQLLPVIRELGIILKEHIDGNHGFHTLVAAELGLT